MSRIIIPSLALLIIGVLLTVLTKHKTAGKVILSVGVFLAGGIIWFFSAIELFFANSNAAFYIAAISIFIITSVLAIILLLFNKMNKKAVYIPILSVFVLCIVSTGVYFGYGKYIENIPKIGEKNEILPDYAPYYSKSKVAILDGEATLRIDRDVPVMDGATALYPIYSAFARAVYPKTYLDTIVQEEEGMGISCRTNDFLQCTTTTGAYESIVTGDADIIFVGGPSEEQKQFAEDNNVELVYTPIGKEAFVFFVNNKNPIDDIKLSDIKGVYSGKITDWSQLGINNFGKIKAFQRDEGSGSQSALIRLMDGEPVINPPEEDVVDGMGGIITKTADYRNFKNSLGFSFRFYSTEMVKNGKIKLLKINGVYPDKENIDNEKYPITSNFYAVTRKDASYNTKKLLEWILSGQGQELIEKTGYTPIKGK